MSTARMRALVASHQFALVAAATLAPHAVMAQDGTAPIEVEPIVVEDEQDSLDGGDGFVATYSGTGLKGGASLLETPRSVSVVTQKELQDRKPLRLENALGYVAGVTASPWGVDDRFDQFLIRGFDIGTYGIFRDGLPQKVIDFSGFLVDPYMMERIDVLRGPVGVLWGENDAGGMVNIITKRPTFENFGEVFASYGSFRTGQLGADFGGTLVEDKLAYRITGLGRLGANETEGSENDRLFLAPALTWTPTEATSITLLSHIQSDSLTPNSFLPVAGEDYDAALGPLPDSFVEDQSDFNKFETDQWSIGYQAEHRFSQALTLRQNFRYAHQDTDYRQLYYGGMADADTMDFVAFTVDESAAAAALDTQLQYDAYVSGLLHNRLLVGFDMNQQTVDGQNGWANGYPIDIANPNFDFGVTNPPIYQDAKQRVRQAGIYAQNLVNFENGLNLSFGLRQGWASNRVEDRLSDTVSKQSYDALTGFAGLTYEFSNGITPYASYTTGFNTNTGLDRNGEMFDPTRGRQYEIGVKYEPTSFNGLFTLALFDLLKTNVLTMDPVDPNFQVQTGEVRHRGIELEARTTLDNGLSILGTYTYLDAEITKSNDGDVGNRTPLVPKHQASAWLDYALPPGIFEGLSVGAGLRYVGDSWGDSANTRKVDDYITVDAALRYEFDKFQLALNASNLLDNEYYATCDAFSGCILGEGRRVMFTLTRQF